jgi:hypothetical protein
METADHAQAQLSAPQAQRLFRLGFVAMLLNVIASLAFVAGIFLARTGEAAPKEPRVIYPEKTELDFEGAKIEGEIRNPGELYFQRRQEEKFGSLVQPRKNFRRAILRDLMQTR